MATLLQILMRRDGMTKDEAEDLLWECGEMVGDGADPEEVLYDELGLEPDYVFDLLKYVTYPEGSADNV